MTENEYLEMPWSIEDTIENLNEIKENFKVILINKNLDGKASDDVKELEFDFDRAINALEKQIPKKPILKHDVSVMHLNMGNKPHQWKRLESDNWHCPECDSFVGERVYVCSKVHDQRKKKYCDNCGQKLDWSDEE